MAEGRHFAPRHEGRDNTMLKPAARSADACGNHVGGAHRTADNRGSRHSRSGRHNVLRVAAVVATALVVVAGVGGVIAWLTASNQVKNAFTLGTVVPDLNESGPEGESFEDGDNIKQNVNVANNGNIPIYVRAQVSIYWLDANGNQMWEEPEPEPDETSTRTIAGDYRLAMGEISSSLPSDANDATWVRGSDGFYYWSAPLDARGATENLIEKFERINQILYEDGRQLICDISIQGIQAEPARAVEEAWGVTVDHETGAITVLPSDGQNAGDSTADSNSQVGA